MAYLKEFELSAPTESKEQRRAFKLQTRCVTSLYERLFEKYKTDKCWKILIECVGEVKKAKFRDLLGVYTVQVQFDFEFFYSLQEIEKKELALETLMAGIKKITEELDWDDEPFCRTYKAVKEQNYVNHWIWKKPVKSPSKKYSAEVLCEHEVELVNISIVVRNKDGEEVSKTKVITEQPDEFAFARHLGKLEWSSNSKIKLVNKKKDKSWDVDFS